MIGFHFVGPNAGEITQGFGLAVRLGAKKSDFDKLVSTILSLLSLPFSHCSLPSYVCVKSLPSAPAPSLFSFFLPGLAFSPLMRTLLVFQRRFMPHLFRGQGEGLGCNAGPCLSFAPLMVRKSNSSVLSDGIATNNAPQSPHSS